MVPVTISRDIFDMQGDSYDGEGREIAPGLSRFPTTHT
jgi:hypothetical protein